MERGEETAICGPLTNATFPSRLTRGIPWHCVIVVRDNGDGHARTIHARVRSAKKKKKLGSASQPRTKLLTASYRTSCCVPSPGRRTTCRGRELVSTTQETAPFFKALPQPFLQPSNVLSLLLRFFLSDSPDFKGLRRNADF